MDTTIIAAVIGAAGVIAAAMLPIFLKKNLHHPKKVGEQALPSPIPIVQGDVERALRAHDQVGRLLRHRNLKDAAEAAVKYFCRGEECKVDGWRTTSTWQQVAAVHAEIVNLSTETPRSQVDQLFQRLLREGRKVSYIRAYEILLGNRPNPWHNMPHCREVLAIAQQSTPQVQGGLTVQLDALIVNQEGTQEPSDGYFTNRGFTREQWRIVFGNWPLM